MNPNPVATSGQGETPITDEKEFIINDWYDDSPNATPVVPADFARELERELTASAARERALRDALTQAEEDISACIMLIKEGQPTDAKSHLGEAQQRILKALTPTRDEGATQ